jgi:hypothetical protein
VDYLVHVVGCRECTAAWRTSGREVQCDRGYSLSVAALDNDAEKALIAFGDHIRRRS